jgi:hypothetical protein
MAFLALGLANFVVVKSFVFTSYCSQNKQAWSVSSRLLSSHLTFIFTFTVLFCSVLKCHSQSLGTKEQVLAGALI